MIYNYHTHTTRCHHAIDSDEEYVKAAIEAGIKYLGFSDHAPVVFDGGSGFHYHMDIEDGEEYVKALRALADKYKEDIHISVGFEMEYYPSCFDKMLELARRFGADYLILGQHFINEEWPDGIGSRAYTENPDHIKQYVDNIIKGVESGVFTYIAHPDIINFNGSEDIYYREMHRLCISAKKHNIPLEINLHGINHGRHYPSDRFFAIAGEVGCPVTFGYDAHESAALLNSSPIAKATEMVKRHRLNYIGMPKLVNIK
jgi:histidinol-phosphatase (PHP family)